MKKGMRAQQKLKSRQMCAAKKGKRTQQKLKERADACGKKRKADAAEAERAGRRVRQRNITGHLIKESGHSGSQKCGLLY
jgi:hypothetical protein